uniref:Kinesin-like protein n=1 Tax=Entomoneis paludosa TaxID=265537 RepID=A0A7S2Y2L7_9STRA
MLALANTQKESIENEKQALKRANDDLYADVGRNLERLSSVELQLKETTRERDEAIHYMASFGDRERELHERMMESDQVRRDLHAKVMQLMGNIRVFVRVRPLSNDELEEVENDNSSSKGTRQKGMLGKEPTFRFPTIADRNNSNKGGPADLTKKTIELVEPKKDRGGLKERRTRHRFGFDNVFQQGHGQDDVWESTEPLIQSAIDGHNVTIFAYGQTGSGKTYTMLGEPGNEGIVTRSIKKMFIDKQRIEALSKGKSQVQIKVELLEIYNEQVFDLLSKDGPNSDRRTVKICHANHTIEGNKVAVTSTEEECMHLLELAQSRRCVKATSSNAKSSRSHLVFTIHYVISEDNSVKMEGKLNICDLAGSERLSRSEAHYVGGALLQETKNINKSLSTLSNVIEQLQAGSKSVAFRESKLTSLLCDSLGGNSKTLAIVCCGPLTSQYHESLSSLRFAEKASNVQLKAASSFSC